MTWCEDHPQEEKTQEQTEEYIASECRRMYDTYCRWYNLVGKVDCDNTLESLAVQLYQEGYEEDVDELVNVVDDALRWVLRPLRKRIPEQGYGDLTFDICDELARLYDLQYEYAEEGTGEDGQRAG
jgi:hypothetical protein